MTQAQPSTGIAAAPVLPEGFLQDACTAVATSRDLGEAVDQLAGLYGLEPEAVEQLLDANASAIDRLSHRTEQIHKAIQHQGTALLARLIRSAADALDAGDMSQAQALGWATLLQKTSGLEQALRDREAATKPGFSIIINFSDRSMIFGDGSPEEGAAIAARKRAELASRGSEIIDADVIDRDAEDAVQKLDASGNDDPMRAVRGIQWRLTS
ncbi:MAG: hypothetical protein RJA63_462 [Pseudomonadota bacterium]